MGSTTPHGNSRFRSVVDPASHDRVPTRADGAPGRASRVGGGRAWVLRGGSRGHDRRRAPHPHTAARTPRRRAAGVRAGSVRRASAGRARHPAGRARRGGGRTAVPPVRRRRRRRRHRARPAHRAARRQRRRRMPRSPSRSPAPSSPSPPTRPAAGWRCSSCSPWRRSCCSPRSSAPARPLPPRPALGARHHARDPRLPRLGARLGGGRRQPVAVPRGARLPGRQPVVCRGARRRGAAAAARATSAWSPPTPGSRSPG